MKLNISLNIFSFLFGSAVIKKDFYHDPGHNKSLAHSFDTGAVSHTGCRSQIRCMFAAAATPFFAWLYCITLAFCCQTRQNRLFPPPFKVHISAPTLPLERFILFSKANSHCRTDISQSETLQLVLKIFSRKIERRFPYRSAFFCKMSSFSVSFLLSVDQCQNEDSDSGNQNHFCHVQNQVHIHKIHPPFSKMHVFKII